MSDKKISDLTAVTIADADSVPIVQNNISRRTLFSTIRNIIQRFSGITEKTTIADNDIYLTNDSADSNNQKKVKHSTVKSNIQNINALDTKATPVTADLLLINDSADSNNPKKITVGTLPAAEGGYAFVGDTAGSAQVTLATKATTISSTKDENTEFKVKKPCMVYMTFVVSATGNSSSGSLEISQNGDWRVYGTGTNAASNSGTTTTAMWGCRIYQTAAATYVIYGISLQPGKYRVRNIGTFSGSSYNLTTTIIATGVSDGALTTASILES
jgi:hypothetical protein